MTPTDTVALRGMLDAYKLQYRGRPTETDDINVALDALPSLLDEVERLREALRSAIIVTPGDDEVGRTYCSACGEWQGGETETHKPDCWLVAALGGRKP